MLAHSAFKSIRLNPTGVTRVRGLTQRDVVVVVALLALIAVLMTFIVLGAMRHDEGMRFVCPSHMKAIGTAFYVYANENNDMWPVPPHLAGDREGFGRVTYAPHKIGAGRTGMSGRPAPPTDSQPFAGGSTMDEVEMSPTRCLWLLVRAGSATPKTFICPNDQTAVPNDEDNPQNYYDFRHYNEVSYGFQIPFGTKGQASSNLPQMPLVADKGPFGFALEMGKPNPGVPNVVNISADATFKEWRRWNSANHGGEGQVVLYADAHADFQTKPTCGIDSDNIYTRWSGAEGFIQSKATARAWGIPPTGTETPWSDTDTFIYP